MSDLLTAETATAYGALDDSAITDGDACHAHVLRTLATQSNRMLTRGHPVWWRTLYARNNVLDPDTGAVVLDTHGDGRFVGSLEWVPIMRPVLVPKKAGLNTYSYAVSVRCPVPDDVVWFYLQTRAGPPPTYVRPDDPHVLQVTAPGTTAITTYTLSGVPGDPGTTDTLSVWIRGKPTTRAYSGANATGTATLAVGSVFGASGVAWPVDTSFLSSTPSPAEAGAYVEMLDGAGVAWSQQHSITSAFDDGLGSAATTTLLGVWPPFSQDETRRAYGATYRMRLMPQIVVVADAIRAEHRSL